VERAKQYRMAAANLRALADRVQTPEVRAELLWLAQSYDRLADAPALNRVVDGSRSLEILGDQQIALNGGLIENDEAPVTPDP
jgi:hypothetical protein